MCGRYVIKATIPELARMFEVEPDDANGSQGPDPVSYNVAPTQAVPVCRVGRDGTRRLQWMHWGLIPSWSKDRRSGHRMINARAETIGERPAFRSAIRRRRCLIPASGFYEWARQGQRKQPYFITVTGTATIAFAGLWEHWRSSEGDSVHSCAIITTEANEALAPLHHRMPVILDAGQFTPWLAPGTDPASVLGMLRPYPARTLSAVPVSTFVNSPRNNDERCLEPIAAPASAPAPMSAAQTGPGYQRS